MLAHIVKHNAPDGDRARLQSLLDRVAMNQAASPRRAKALADLAALLGQQHNTAGWTEIAQALRPLLDPLLTPPATETPPVATAPHIAVAAPKPNPKPKLRGPTPPISPRATATTARIPVKGPLYLAFDEYWPTCADPALRAEGVIAGLALLDGLASVVGWPIVPNHVVDASPAVHGDAVRRVFSTTSTLPLLLPLRAVGDCAQREYEALIRAALLVVLGWVLAPADPAKAVDVHVIFGEIGGFPAGSTSTERFAGVLEGIALVAPERFAGWRIREVRFTRGGEALIAYADAVGDLARTHDPAMARLAAELDLRSSPGYFELSTELLPMLLRLEQMERAGNVRDILTLARDLHRSALLAGVFDELRARIARNGWLRGRLLREVNERFDRADITRPELEVLADVADALLAPAPDDPVSLRALHAALQVQRANHDGAPERARDALDRWSSLASEVREQSPHTALVLELHLAVHLDDSLRFAEAHEMLARWVSPVPHAGLTAQSLGWVYSSLGQSLAYLGLFSEAAARFDAALECLRQSVAPPDAVLRDLDQVGCYRALNAVCMGRERLEENLREYLGQDLGDVAEGLAKSAEPGSRYRHHLLLRWLYDREAPAAVWSRYKARGAGWATGEGHPWALIEMYRALLLHRDGELDARSAADRCWEAGRSCDRGGATLLLIGGTIGAVACALVPDGERSVELARRFEEVVRVLPSAAECVTKVREGRDPRTVLAGLPFNFR